MTGFAWGECEFVRVRVGAVHARKCVCRAQRPTSVPGQQVVWACVWVRACVWAGSIQCVRVVGSVRARARGCVPEYGYVCENFRVGAFDMRVPV